VASALVVALILGGGTVWALNRFVIEHASIRDVDAYEAANSAGTATESTETIEHLLLTAFTGLGVALLPAKVFTDVTLYVSSFLVQRRFVFARRTFRSQEQEQEARRVDAA